MLTKTFGLNLCMISLVLISPSIVLASPLQNKFEALSKKSNHGGIKIHALPNGAPAPVDPDSICLVDPLAGSNAPTAQKKSSPPTNKQSTKAAPNKPAVVPVKVVPIVPVVTVGKPVPAPTVPQPAQVDPNAPPPDPKPTKAAESTYENEKIEVIVISPRYFGYRIGDEISLLIAVHADESITLNFDAIKAGVLSPNGQDFEVMSKPEIHYTGQKKGKNTWVIGLIVQTFVPKPEIVFNADLLYTLEPINNPKVPIIWKRLTTPDFVVSTSNTGDNSEMLLDGNVDPSPVRKSWFTYPLLLIGLILALWWPALLFLSWYTRVMPKVDPQDYEIAWKSFRKAFARGKIYGFSPGIYRQVLTALRKYLQVKTLTLSEIQFLLNSHPRLDTISKIISQCESVIYAGKVLTEAENEQLLQDLEKIVPKD